MQLKVHLRKVWTLESCCQLQPYLGQGDLASVRLQSCNALCVGLPAETTWKVPRVQNATAPLLHTIQ